MNFEFFQGVTWTCLLLGLWSFVIRPNLKPALILKLMQVFMDTIKSSKNTLEMKQEGHMLKIESQNETLYLPTFETKHMLDVVCYQDSEHQIKIPITFFQYKNQYVYIPFKPKDISLHKVYIGIKFLTRDTYKFYEIEEDDFIDLPSLFNLYELQLFQEPEPELAEAYDD